MKDIGNQPAFPKREDRADGSYSHTEPGMTYRQWLIGMVLQGLVQGSANDILLRRTDITFSDHAVRIADSQIAELEKE